MVAPRRGHVLGLTTLTVTEASRGFADAVNRARYKGERFILTRGGKAVAQLGPVSGRSAVRAVDLLRALPGMPSLGATEAARFARDLARARAAPALPKREPWASS